MSKRLNIPSREKILNTWWNMPRINGKDFLGQKTNGKLCLDSDTDRCWCCRRLENWWLDSKGEIDQSRNISIERCHVIPDSLGGKNNPLNFVLMCSECHRKSPDIKSETAIFKWMEAQHDKETKYLKEYQECVEAHFPELATTKGDFNKGLDKVILNIKFFFETRVSKDFRKWFSKNTSYHFGESEKASTEVLALREFIDNYHPFPDYP